MIPLQMLQKVFFFLFCLTFLKDSKYIRNHKPLSYNFKLSKLPVQCSASPTPARSFVWCPARILLPRFSVSPKITDIPHPLCDPGLTAAMWSSCGAHEQACECRRVHPTYSLSHINIFYGRVSTRIMKTIFKSKRRQIFDEYQGKTAGWEGMGRKVWIERLSCPALPGAAGSVTEVADGCPLPAVGKGTAPLTAAGLQTLSGWLLATAGATLHNFTDSKLFWSVLAITWLPAVPGEQSTPLLGCWDLGRGSLALGCRGQRPLCCQPAQAALTWELLFGWWCVAPLPSRAENMGTSLKSLQGHPLPASVWWRCCRLS